jgi:hypothetical protein
MIVEQSTNEASASQQFEQDQARCDRWQEQWERNKARVEGNVAE